MVNSKVYLKVRSLESKRESESMIHNQKTQKIKPKTVFLSVSNGTFKAC